MRKAMSRTLVLVAGVVAVAMLLACGSGGSSTSTSAPAAAPTGPIKVTMSWNEGIDIDMTVNGSKGYEVGGAADVRTGPGSESITLPAAGVTKIGARNNSTAGDANVTFTIEIPGMTTVTKTGIVYKEMAKDDYTAFSIDSVTGVVTDINTYE